MPVAAAAYSAAAYPAPIAQPWSPAGPPFPPPTGVPAGGPQAFSTRATGPPQAPTPRPPVAVKPVSPHRSRLRTLAWLLLIVLLGCAAFVLGTQAGAITAFVQKPLPTSSTRAAPTTAPTTARPSSIAPSSAPTGSGTTLALQVTVQGVSQVLAGLPSGKSKDRLVAEWSTVGAAVLRGDHPNDQLDGFASKVQKEVRSGGVSLPEGVAILGAVETVRAAL
jgi:hypothetical protein